MLSITYLHGWLLWVGWGILGFIQVVSNRYLKNYFRIYMWIHRITGTLILLITIAMGITGIRRLDWQLVNDGHYIIGLIVFFMVFFIAVGGVAARSRTRRIKWDTKGVITNKFGHKVGLNFLF